MPTGLWAKRGCKTPTAVLVRYLSEKDVSHGRWDRGHVESRIGLYKGKRRHFSAVVYRYAFMQTLEPPLDWEVPEGKPSWKDLRQPFIFFYRPEKQPRKEVLLRVPRYKNPYERDPENWSRKSPAGDFQITCPQERVPQQ